MILQDLMLALIYRWKGISGWKDAIYVFVYDKMASKGRRIMEAKTEINTIHTQYVWIPELWNDSQIHYLFGQVLFNFWKHQWILISICFNENLKFGTKYTSNQEFLISVKF